MVCSRYFHPSELPSDLIVRLINPYLEHGFLFPIRTKADRERSESGRYNYERAEIWFVYLDPHDSDRPECIKRQILTRSVGTEYWGAGDVNPRWPGRVEGTEWYATEEQARSALDERQRDDRGRSRDWLSGLFGHERDGGTATEDGQGDG